MLCTDPKRRIIPGVAKCHNYFRYCHVFFPDNTQTVYFSSYDPTSLGLSPNIVAHSPQMLQMAAAQQSQNVLNQYLPALTTIYQQLSYAPAIYVQNVQIPPPTSAAVAATAAIQQSIAAQTQNAFMPAAAAAAIFPNPAALQSFGHVIQQLIAPANQYAQLTPTFPLMTNQAAMTQQIPQQQILLAQQPQLAQQHLMGDPQQFCYQLQGRPPSRSRSPL